MVACISLYVHIPWCAKKCPYCDFNSHAVRDVPDWQDYLAVLLKDLQHQIATFSDWAGLADRQLVSVFIGGGTPSLLPPEFYLLLLKQVRSLFVVHPELEVTLEANPGRLDQAHLPGYRDAGINRLSLGVQSFNAQALIRLGRVHSAEQAHRAIEQALDIGFDKLNIDLMMGLSGQSLEDCMADLTCALDYPLHHLSWYQLTIEPNTEFFRRPPNLPAEDTLEAMQQAGLMLLSNACLTAYEVSAYARDDVHQSIHNQHYWSFGDYLGIGAGAHGKLRQVQGCEVVRTRQHKMPDAYQQQIQFPHHARPISTTDIIFEYALNRWRLAAPFSLQEFEEKTGLPRDCLSQPLQQAQTKGLIDQIGEAYWQKTPLGERFLNDLVELFMPTTDMSGS